MKTIHVVKKTEPDGSLSLRIPLGRPQAEYEVLIVVQPTDLPTRGQTAQERGWPRDYFENTYGSITDETFFRQPQGELPKPVDLD